MGIDDLEEEELRRIEEDLDRTPSSELEVSLDKVMIRQMVREIRDRREAAEQRKFGQL